MPTPANGERTESPPNQKVYAIGRVPARVLADDGPLRAISPYPLQAQTRGQPRVGRRAGRAAAE